MMAAAGRRRDTAGGPINFPNVGEEESPASWSGGKARLGQDCANSAGQFRRYEKDLTAISAAFCGRDAMPRPD
jgi:hypothetical protein